MREIQTDHWVRLPDGNVGRVRYVHEATGLVDVNVRGDWNDTVSLPLRELRRTTDPAEALPPIEGIPEERPLCATCNKPLLPVVRKHYADLAITVKDPMARRYTRRTFEGWRGYPRRRPLFHSTHCAVRFAEAAHKAGYHIVRT